MPSSTPWKTDSKYDPLWHYSEFVRWVLENRELIKDKMIDGNNVHKRKKRGIAYSKPQIDELFVLSANKDLYYYWFDYTTVAPRQYLINDDSIENLILYQQLDEIDYTQIPRRITNPHQSWEAGDMITNHLDLYRIRFKDIRKITPLINWNETPWEGK